MALERRMWGRCRSTGGQGASSPLWGVWGAKPLQERLRWLGRIAIAIVVVWGGEVRGEEPIYRTYAAKVHALLKKNPTDPRLWTIVGRIYLRGGAIREAEGAFAKAFALSPGFSHAKVGMALVALQRREWSKAEGWLKEVLEKEPRHASALAAQSEYYRVRPVLKGDRKEADLQEALRYLRLALKEKPQTPPWHIRAGILFLGVRRYAEAHRSFAKAAELRPEDGCSLLGVALSESLLFPDDHPRLSSLALALRGCRRHPTLVAMGKAGLQRLSLAQAHKALGKKQPKEAIRWLSWLLSEVPEAWQSRIFLASLFLQAKRCKEAQALVKSIPQAYPSPIEFRRFLLDPGWSFCHEPKPTTRPSGGRPPPKARPPLQRG